MDDVPNFYTRVRKNSPEYDKLYARLKAAVDDLGSIYKFCQNYDISYTIVQRALNMEGNIGPSIQRALDRGRPLPLDATYSTRNPAARRVALRPKPSEGRSRHYAHKPKRIHTDGEDDDTPATPEQRLKRATMHMLREIDVKDLPRGITAKSTPSECANAGVRKINSIYRGVPPKFYVLKGRGNG